MGVLFLVVLFVLTLISLAILAADCGRSRRERDQAISDRDAMFAQREELRAELNNLQGDLNLQASRYSVRASGMVSPIFQPFAKFTASRSLTVEGYEIVDAGGDVLDSKRLEHPVHLLKDETLFLTFPKVSVTNQ